jgi:hypothetical protein
VMILPELILVLLGGNSDADQLASRQIAVPCSLVREKANQYFIDHHFFTGAIAGDSTAGVSLEPSKDALTPSGSPLALNRSSIGRYTLHRHLSPMKSYTTFRITGQLSLTAVSATACTASLHFDFSAFEYVWALAVIDDGYRSQFTSNGNLERGYLDSITAQVVAYEKARR